MSFTVPEVCFIVIEALLDYILVDENTVCDTAASFSHLPTFKQNRRSVKYVDTSML
jgi:hypothetical protein